MALAADNGWNIFIVLSGTIEKLREQTQKRLLDDLMQPSMQNWVGLNKNPPTSASEPQSPTRIVLGPNYKNRYLAVCLKNSTRLEKLRLWLHNSPEVAQQMRIIIIDDEADQAGINTLVDKDEVTKINQHILEIVNGEKYNDKSKSIEKKVTYGAVNYIGYTATPYANVLNDTAMSSLYPRDFIRILKPSRYYFGPARIFGETDTERLELFREIPHGDNADTSGAAKKISDFDVIKSIHDGELTLPVSFKDSICWYICSAAAFRVLDIKDPSSMLIHTSHKIEHHSKIREAVETWLRDSKSEVLALCEEVWRRETSKLTLANFCTQINSIEGQPAYPCAEITDYPNYSQILPHVKDLVGNVSHIELEDNNGEQQQSWHNGLHICEDNCKKSGEDEDGIHLRLMYPPREQRSYSHAFIIIGGNTLSRGLTLEGLVSSYFLRDSTMTADTLTQMGRWFGFRRGYELYPRIWMTEKTFSKFKRISLSEKSLREEIVRYAIQGLKPCQFAPRILTHPLSRMIPTARNKMNAAKPGLDFSGNSIQTTVFFNEKSKLLENTNIVADFVCNTSRDKEYELIGREKKLWRNVSGSIIRDLIKKYNFHDRAKDFAYKPEMLSWLEEQEKTEKWQGWSVALCGLETHDKEWNISTGLSIKKTNFFPYKRPEGNYNAFAFKTIRERKDLLIDVNTTVVNEYLGDMGKTFKELTMSDIWMIRKKDGLEYIPQIIVYCLDKDYESLNAPADFVGFSIFFPGFDYRKTVKLEYVQAEIEDDDSSDILD
jgi:hypothetical protein